MRAYRGGKRLHGGRRHSARRSVDLAHFDPAQPRDPEGRWFHGSSHDFNPGDLVLPRAVTGAKSWAEQIGYTGPDISNPKRVYLTRSRVGAMDFGHYVYEVEPVGEVNPDPEYPSEWFTSDRALRVVRKVVDHNRAVDLAHFDPAEPRDPRTGRWWKSGPVSGRAGDLFGKGLDALFPDYGDGRLPLVLVPWSPARRRKDEPMFNADLLRQASEDLVAVDPRSLHSTQPNVSLAGVRHYFEGKPGLFADKSNPGNQVPVIYRRARTGENIILAGHHRAAAALLKGEPLIARYVAEPAEHALSKSEKPTPAPGEPGGPGHVDLANPSIRRTRYVTKQLFDSHDPVTLLHHRGFSVPVAQAVAGLVDPRTGGTVTRPNLPRQGVALNLPMRIERDREALYRGGYILKAAERIQAAVDKGTPLADAVENERRFYAAHEKARRGRLEAVVKAQIAGRWSGEPVRVNGTWRTLVGWNLDPLINNDTECKIANGHNFYAEEGTLIGFPGGVHPNCGCWAGPPFAGAGLVNDALRGVTSLEQRPKYVLSRKRKTA